MDITGERLGTVEGFREAAGVLERAPARLLWIICQVCPADLHLCHSRDNHHLDEQTILLTRGPRHPYRLCKVVAPGQQVSPGEVLTQAGVEVPTCSFLGGLSVAPSSTMQPFRHPSLEPKGNKEVGDDTASRTYVDVTQSNPSFTIIPRKILMAVCTGTGGKNSDLYGTTKDRISKTILRGKNKAGNTMLPNFEINTCRCYSHQCGMVLESRVHWPAG